MNRTKKTDEARLIWAEFVKPGKQRSAGEWQRMGLDLVRWGARHGLVKQEELLAAELRAKELASWPKERGLARMERGDMSKRAA